MDKDYGLVIAKLLGGEPLDVNLPVPIEIGEICNIDTAEPGEDVYKWSSAETTADSVKTIDANGVITATKVTLKGKTALNFTSLNTDKEYIEIDELLSSPDQKVFERRRNALVRGLDKIEVRLLLKLVTDDTDVVTISIPSAGDIYDTIADAKHALEDYGDTYVLLAGSAVKETIDNYDKKKVGSFNYKVDLMGYLSKVGIKVRKIFGTVKYTGDDSAQRLLDTNKFILVAIHSTIKEGKPLWFVRRRLNPEIAKMMDADVDKAQRGLFVERATTQVTNTEVLAFGVFAFESIVMANANYKALVKSADLSSIML